MKKDLEEDCDQWVNLGGETKHFSLNQKYLFCRKKERKKNPKCEE
jgi:hypothetical protein